MIDAVPSNPVPNERALVTGLAKRPWSVDRWGRLLAGFGILLLTALGIFHHPAWLIGTLLASSNLVVAALSDRCPIHDLLIRLGAKEREDLFIPGGSVRACVVKRPDSTGTRINQESHGSLRS